MCHRHNLRRPRRADANLADAESPAHHLPGTDAPGIGFWEGYTDALHGRQAGDFGTGAAEALAYEEGRELALTLLAHGLRVRWPDRRVLPAELIAAAAKVVL
jgi:hypothetical protein